MMSIKDTLPSWFNTGTVNINTFFFTTCVVPCFSMFVLFIGGFIVYSGPKNSVEVLFLVPEHRL